MSRPGFIWTHLLKKPKNLDRPAMRRHEQHRKVIDLLRSDFRDLYDCRQEATLTAEQSADLVAKLKGKASIHDYKHRIQFLVQGLEAGINHLRWDVVLPPIPQYAPREISIFTPQSFAGLNALHAFEETFLASLEHNPPPTRSARLGQLLVSAILHGGLHERRWFNVWLDTLATVRICYGLLWLDMELTVVKKSKAQKKATEDQSDGEFCGNKPVRDEVEWKLHRRWVADPLTAALILRWRRDFPEDLLSWDKNRSDSLYYRHFSHWLNSPSTTPYKNLSDLVSDATTNTALKLPSFLASYATGKIKSVCLPQEAWTRFLTDKSVHRKKSDKDEVFSPYKKQPLDILWGQSFHPVEQQQLLRALLTTVLPAKQIRKRSSAESRAALEDFLERNRQKLSPLLQLVTTWGIDLLTHYRSEDLNSHRVKSRLRPSTVRRYLQPVAAGLLAEARECDYDLLSLEEDDFHDLYLGVVECCSTMENKLYTGGCLLRFHDFLVATCDAPVVDFSDIAVRKGPSELGVDANLISPGQFEKIKKVLWGNGSNSSRLRTMQVLSTILSYRCGLRRREAIRVQLIHIHGDVHLELLLRHSKYGYLKSSDSVRRLPLYLLLPADEMQYFRQWVQRRRTEFIDQPDSALLFCLEDTPTKPLDENEFFAPIEKALRQVTDDQTIRYHHLRHSFGSYLLLRLVWEQQLEHHAQKLPFLRDQSFNHKQLNSLRKGLLGNHRLGRKKVYAVSMLLGHAGPDVTLLHYIHFCDLLLGLGLSRAELQAPLTVKALQKITGIGRSATYRTLGKDTAASGSILPFLPDMLAEAEKGMPDPLVSSARPPSTKRIPERWKTNGNRKLAWPDIQTIIHALTTNTASARDLSLRYGIKEDILIRWSQLAIRIGSMKTKNGELRHVNKRTAVGGKYRVFPVPVRLRTDRKLVDFIFTRVMKMSASDKAKVRSMAREFIRRYSAQAGEARFKSPKRARRFLDTLALLGIAPTLITVIRFPSATRNALTEEKQRKVWEEALGAQWNYITASSLSAGKIGTVGIRVSATSSKSDSASQSTARQFKSSYGFRYAIYLLAILMNVSPDSSD